MAAQSSGSIRRVTLMSLIMTMGIVFGDIGTSPLYVMKAITGVNPGYTSEYIIGAVSCIIWTLTLQTTVKYVLIALRADHNGEGGVLSLYSLLKRVKAKWIYIPAVIGASTLIADGVITPAVTVTSAIEGLQDFSPDVPVIGIVITVIAAIFIFQRYGTGTIGKFFGPFMLLWFLMLGATGMAHLFDNAGILKAFNPYYAINLLINYPAWFLILGAVFLCTTGAEALYSDLGHCGRWNITYSWLFVKVMLILNYLGQGAWLINMQGTDLKGVNPFYAIIPHEILFLGIIMSTGAAIIASQALLSGSFTIFSEAINLDFWPRLRIKFPSEHKGQLYIPIINLFLFSGCILTVLIFRNSSNMEAAYGLAITITMLCTTLLLALWMKTKNINRWIIAAFLMVFITIESIFLISNAFKFAHGGWYTILLGGIVCAVMLIWRRAIRIRRSFVEYLQIKDQLEIISDIKDDTTIPRYASNLVYVSKSDKPDEVESKLMYSIINKSPKRADHYWIIRIHHENNPDTLDYKCNVLIPETLYSIDMYIGYRINPRVSVFLRQIIEDLTDEGKINLTSRHPSLEKRGIAGDFRFIIIHRVFDPASYCSSADRTIMNLYKKLRYLGISDSTAFGLDTSIVSVETVPLIINRGQARRIRRHIS